METLLFVNFFVTTPFSITTAIPPLNPTLPPRSGVYSMLMLASAAGVRLTKVAYQLCGLPSLPVTLPVRLTCNESMIAVPSALKPMLVPYLPICITLLLAINMPYGSGAPL
ncbi:hypothetical protein D1872_301070 [compost metagenome]